MSYKSISLLLPPTLYGTAPEDYTSPDAIPVTLNLESPQVFVLVAIVDDNVYDGTKVFYATISSQSERVSISENRTRVVIRDNEGKKTVSISISTCVCIPESN